MGRQAKEEERMRRSFLKALLVGALIVLAVTATACGGGGGGGTKKGGTLTMLTSGDVDDNLDPGYSYYQLDFIYNYAVERPVLSYKPTDLAKASPDLAASYPSVSGDGKTVTIKLKKGIKFAPPVNREVTSADVKYAIERSFLPKVGNGYVNLYWADLIGKDDYVKAKANDIKGLTTPDKYTLVMKFSRPTGAVAAQALALPASAPVPKEYAAKYDKGTKPTYGEHVVATGPYMVENNPTTGKITGYQPGRRLTLVRNPNWDKSTDFRPAYVDKIVFAEGNDPAVGNRKILSGSGMIGNPTDLSPPPAFLKANLSKKDNLIQGPFTDRVRYVALNTTKKPFDDPNVRKAVAAGLDRASMNLAFGGKTVGAVANHILTPGINGFAEAGGFGGEGFDFLKNPSGDPQLAASYLKKAGFKSGKYSGPTLLMAVDNSTNQKAAAQVALNGFQKLGFKVNFRPMPRDTMYSKFCNVPKNEPEVCPTVGWLKDFADAQTMLDPTFNGKNIVQTGNVNWPQLNDPKINKAMDDAETIVAPADRAVAWAKIDRLVTGTAAAIPWQWDKAVLVKSTNVKAVISKWNAAWDVSFTSLK
jgi:peptide/nickel transport system substrate-binding protein